MRNRLRRRFRAATTLLVACALFGPIARADGLGERIGFYQWQGVNPDSNHDLLTAARLRATALGAGVFRFYLGARFDYSHPLLSAHRFEEELGAQERTPADILALPRYRAVLEDPKLRAVILTAYSALDYGGGPDDVNLLRPWGPREDAAVREQIGQLCRFLFEDYGHLDKTVILANHEADEKLMEILNHREDPAMAIDNLVAWTNARFEAIDAARRLYPKAQLQVYHAFEISTVNLKIGKVRDRYRKTNGAGWNAVQDVLPRIHTDLLSYSAYESANSPFATLNADRPPEETAARLHRDLARIRALGASRISPVGRARFGDDFVMIGELGFARERFEPLPTGGVLPRLYYALQTALESGCPYVVLWQLFDAPRMGDEAWGFGAYSRDGEAPGLTAPAGTCDSIAACLKSTIDQGLENWRPEPPLR